MKVFVILALTISAVWGAKKCNKGAADGKSLTEETCEAAMTTCTSPMFVEYTGMSSQTYGCGSCGENKDLTCKECTSEDDGAACNTAVTAPTDAHTFECFAHTYDSETKKFKAAEKATTCNALKDTVVKCNSPGASAEAAYVQANGGCGPCAKGTIDAKTCVECDKTGCNNSATTFAFVLMPLLAAIFNLL